MTNLEAHEAKDRFAKLLKRAASGERIVITKHGVPMAELIPTGKTNNVGPKEAIAALQSFRKGHRLNGVSIRGLIEEERR